MFSESWQVIVDYCANGIPYSQYIWMGLIIVLGVWAVIKAKKMISEI
jgi:hypothetical protein